MNWFWLNVVVVGGSAVLAVVVAVLVIYAISIIASVRNEIKRNKR